MKLFFIFFFLAVSLMTSAQLNVTTFPSQSDLTQWSNYSGSKTIVFNNDSIVAQWQNGMLNGEYNSFYRNGQMKASGQYRSNHRTGKWTLYSADGKGKVVINFNKYGYVTLNRARIPGKGGVRFGRGKVEYAVPDFNSNFTGAAEKNLIQGSVHFRHGLKNGLQKEFYSDGTLRSETPFRDGLYDGTRKIFHPNAVTAFQLDYANGSPMGQRKEFTTDGGLVSSRFMESASGGPTFYLDKFDVFMSSRKMLYTDTAFDKTNLFFSPDSAAPLFEVLNDAFIKGNLSAYSDNELSEVYFPFHDKPDLSGLSEGEGNSNNLRGFLIKVDEVFNTQTWLVYKFPVAIEPVASFPRHDSVVFKGGPWLYFPQLRSEIPESNYHFSFFKSFGYPFITASTSSATPWVMDYADMQKIANEQLRSTELEHDLWMVFYGLRKDGKVW